MQAQNMFDLTGHRALVTGSSRGIGREIALTLAAYGADVMVHCAGCIASASQVVSQIRDMGRKSAYVQQDLSDAECAEHIMAETEDAMGGIDILVLNASMQIKKPWSTYTAEDFDAHMHVNVRASMLLIQRTTPYMISQNWGRIVAVGSVQEFCPHPDMLVYSSTKAAQSMLIQSLAGQLGGYGITVNNFAPGVILTDRNTEALADAAYVKRVTEGIPAGYFGETRDCAGPVLLLCSDAGRYITGQTLLADGGKHLPRA